jgi:exonuclease SbcC
MIPVKLTIQGLYSYQEKQTIDFTRLTAANLFGIFGAVGSGKSSILEAITFAVYGETDRLNARDSRNYNMMNLKSSDLLIEFDFETGKEQTAYRAVVKGRRNSKKFDDVKALDRAAYRCENGSWLPIEPDSLKEVIGLSYENFKRTIIIPQGQFQEFLQLGNKERAVMMKSLFNLERFELDSKAALLEGKNNAQKQNLEGQLQQLGAIDPEQVSAFQEKLEGLRKEIGGLNQKMTETQKLEAELKQLFDLFAKKEEINRKLVGLKRQLPEFELLDNKVLNFEYCFIHFKNILDGLNTSAQKIQFLDKKITDESLTLKQSEERIGMVEVQFETIKAEYDTREILRQTADELEKLIRLAELRQMVAQAEDRVNKGEAVVQQTVETIEKLKQEKENLDVSLREKKAMQPDMLVLSNARSWHELQANITQQLASTSAETEKCRGEITASVDTLRKLFDDVGFVGFTGELEFTNGIVFLKDRCVTLKRQVTDFDAEMQHFGVQLKLEEFAIGLKEGDACPVCGSLHHPQILVAADVAVNLKQTERKKLTVETEIRACEQLIERLVEVNNQVKVNEKQLQGIEERRKELDGKLAAHQQVFQWKKYQTREAVVEAFQLAEALKKSVELLEKQGGETAKKYDQVVVNKDKYRQQIDKIKLEVVAFKAEIETLTGQIRHVNAEEYSYRPKAEIEVEKDALLKKYLSLEKQFGSLGNQLLELRKNKDVLMGSVSANRTQLGREKTVEEELKASFKKELEASVFETQESIGQILNQELNVAAEKMKITTFRQEMSVTQNQLEQALKEIGERTYDPENHRQLQEQLENDRQMLNRLNQDLGATEKSLADLKNALEIRAELRKTLEKLESRAENIRTLRGLFKASGFVNYISSVYLQNLSNAANDRFFRLTRQKLSLEITEDNNFQVRDYMNGGRIRSVKTLSGGQTFQAALCLALALADNIQRITESNQNFFFLDEGFGSLDKESLSVVFDALKSLRKENRIVGVISHVEEMQQEIDTHLRIENHEEYGSRILTSW